MYKSMTIKSFVCISHLGSETWLPGLKHKNIAKTLQAAFLSNHHVTLLHCLI